MGGRSFGYKADGKVYHDKTPIEQTYPKFNKNDIIGCGINFLKREIFFTFNGEIQGVAFKDICNKDEELNLYATVGLHSMNESLTFNFGAHPFAFDVKTLIMREKKEIIARILNQKIPPIATHQIVHNYLYMNDYHRTLEAFEASSQLERTKAFLVKEPAFFEAKPNENRIRKNSCNQEIPLSLKKPRCRSMMLESSAPSENDQSGVFYDEDNDSEEVSRMTVFKPVSLCKDPLLAWQAHEKDRMAVKTKILEGKSLEALHIVNGSLPALIKEFPIIEFLLKVQHFIELMVSKNQESAILFAKESLGCTNENFIAIQGNKIEEVSLDVVYGLLCYTDLESCPLSFLVDQKQRELIADAFNKLMLKHLKFSDKSLLDLLLCQLSQIESRIKENGYFAGERFDIRL